MQPRSNTSSDELLWVNVKNPTDIKNAGVMKQIRSHTQREVRRKERISKPKYVSTSKCMAKGTNRASMSPSASTKVTVVAKKEKPTENKPTSAEDQRIKIHKSLQDLATESFLCPSPSLAISVSPQNPVRLNQKIYRYLRLWQGDRALQLCGGSIHGRWEFWMPTVLTNNIMMYAQAFCAASHFEFWGRQSTTADTWALKDQAVMQVNKNLGNPDFSQNDTNVAAVLCLAFASHVENSGKENCMAHMNGLQKIIDMRGGWDRVLSNQLLSDLLAMADFVSAIIYNTSLVYTPTDTRESKTRIDDRLKSPLNPLDLFTYQSDQGDLCLEAFQTLSDMQKLTKSFEEFYTNPELSTFLSTGIEDSFGILQPPSSPGMYLQSSSSSSSSPIERSPIRFGSASASSPGSSSSTSFSGGRDTFQKVEYLNEAIRLAGCIYYRSLVRKVSFENEANLEDARQLKFYLEATAITGWTERPGALLWALLVATAALRSQPEGFIVSGHLSTSILCIGVRHWLPVRRMLEKFMHIESLVDQNAYHAALCGSSYAISSASASVSSACSGFRRRSVSVTDMVDDEAFEGERFKNLKAVDTIYRDEFIVPEGIVLQV